LEANRPRRIAAFPATAAHMGYPLGSHGNGISVSDTLGRFQGGIDAHTADGHAGLALKEFKQDVNLDYILRCLQGGLGGVLLLVVPCELVLATDTVCFVTTPATVAMLAEGIEELVGASDGRLVRSAWQSANGVHRVDLLLADQVWGALEVWLSETTDRSVTGLIRYVPQHRLKGQ
jgi:hypothetical protein